MAYLNQRGYVLVKNLNLPETIKKVKKDLEVKPKVNSLYTSATIFDSYMENDAKMYLPKQYALNELLGGNIKGVQNNIPDGEKIYIHFKGQLRDNQKLPVGECLRALNDPNRGGGILQLPPGFGKTICAIYLITQLKTKTIIIVNKEFLMNQWKDRIQQVCPTARIGVIQQKKFEVENKDIVVAMLQTLSYRQFGIHDFKSFGFSIWDECHNIGTEIFSKSMFKVGTKHRLGLSATPERMDGLSIVFKWHLGDIIFALEQERKGLKPEAKIYRYTPVSTNENCQELMNQSDNPNIPVMLTNVCNDPVRNQLTVDILKQNVEKERKVLLLSERVEHLKELHRMYSKLDISKVHTGALYIGSTKQKERDESDSASVIFGSVKLISEAYDNPKLDTLIFACFNGGPIRKNKASCKLMDQTTGRIFRKTHTVRPAVVIDIQDTFSVFKNQGYRRASYYKNNGYSLSITTAKETNDGYTLKTKNKKQSEIEADLAPKRLAGKLTGFLILDD